MIEFIYNGNKYYTEKLDKKLKRLKITKDDIQIIREFNPIKEQETIEYPDWYYCYFYNPNNKISYITVSKDHKKPDKSELYKNIFNNETKTGIKEFTKEYIDNLILLDGKPKFPITLDKNNLPILETIYEWK